MLPSVCVLLCLSVFLVGLCVYVLWAMLPDTNKFYLSIRPPSMCSVCIAYAIDKPISRRSGNIDNDNGQSKQQGTLQSNSLLYTVI